MSNICFIGSSHVSALKLGLKLLQERDVKIEKRLTIFGTPRNSLTSCTIEGGVITPGTPAIKRYFEMTSGGEAEIRLSQYDDVYVVAGYSPYNVIRFVSPDTFPPPSHALYASVARRWKQAWPYVLARKIKAQAPDVRVHFLGAPPTSEQAPQAQGILSPKGADEEQARIFLLQTRRMIDRCVAEVPLEIDSLVAPPPQCLEAFNMFTKHAYCAGSVGLTQELDHAHVSTDFIHMNGLYGIEVLKSIGVVEASA